VKRKLLILRPQAGAERTARRIAELGVDPVVAPLFEVVPLAWQAPDPAAVEAVMLTSANAASHAGASLSPFLAHPCYAVGEASAAAARAAGFGDVRIGRGDGKRLLDRLAADGIERVLHLCGRDHLDLERPRLRLVRRFVYAAEASETLPPDAAAALRAGAVALIHSPRSGALFRGLVEAAGLDPARIAVAAISPAAAAAAGRRWSAVAIAPVPRDHALLEVAAKLCKGDAIEATESGA
jgi:uroporphyrinogen-III synthase